MTLRHILLNVIIEDMVVLKELIFNSFHYWAGCGGLERTEFLTVAIVGRCGVPERTESTDLILPQ